MTGVLTVFQSTQTATCLTRCYLSTRPTGSPKFYPALLISRISSRNSRQILGHFLGHIFSEECSLSLQQVNICALDCASLPDCCPQPVMRNCLSRSSDRPVQVQDCSFSSKCGESVNGNNGNGKLGNGKLGNGKNGNR